ncbi:hypothetical protein ACFYTQ_13830 [Nocardia sp. NPDC004068]|uniref:hypothetical protein n=1 Tax=Nocardia sp. NPDC004068 TaxID=3364303 RepID=UPI0036C248DB
MVKVARKDAQNGGHATVVGFSIDEQALGMSESPRGTAHSACSSLVPNCPTSISKECVSVRRYLVKVHCCGSRWLIQVPAVDRWTPVDDKKAIEPTARQMIAALTGAAPDTFDVDLSAGPVIGDIEEYAVGARGLQRWQAPETASIGRSPQPKAKRPT